MSHYNYIYYIYYILDQVNTKAAKFYQHVNYFYRFVVGNSHQFHIDDKFSIYFAFHFSLYLKHWDDQQNSPPPRKDHLQCCINTNHLDIFSDRHCSN